MIRNNSATNPTHNGLRSRTAAALAAGCLALSLCPAIALAAPPSQGDAPQGGNPPAMQQEAPEGQAPEGQPSNNQAPKGQAPEGQAPDVQAPDGQQQPSGEAPEGNAPAGEAPNGNAPAGEAPDGQQGLQGQQPKDDALSDQARQLLADEFGIDAAGPSGDEDGQDAFQGKPEDAPEIPEGEFNVQQIIDTLRDILSKYGIEALSSQLSDSDFAAEVADYAVSANDQRFADFANGAAPGEGAAPAEGDAPEMGEAPAEGAAPEKGAAPSDGQIPADKQDGDTVDSSIMQQIISLIMSAFGYTVEA